MNPLQSIAHRYFQLFQQSALVIKAPGRFNLIGEHTDYNEGWVLPAAIDKHIYFALDKNEQTDQVKFYSPEFEETIQFSLTLNDLAQLPNWAKYLKAATQELQDRGYSLQGVTGAVVGDIPLGAGLSSSAALCCGFIKGLAMLNDIELSTIEIAHIGQAAEHRVGLNCGIMDQCAVLFGKKDHAVFLDCRSLEIEHVPLTLGDYRLLLFNSNIKHELAADSGYNERRAACERVVQHIQTIHPEVRSLRDVTPDLLQQFQAQLSSKDHKRAYYVLKENERVLKAKKALQQGDLQQLGNLLYQSHAGLRDEYEVTVLETDLLVELTKNQPGVLGSRMTGGGFGGCILTLVHQDHQEALIDFVCSNYESKTKRAATVYEIGIDDGVRVI